jgi:hypothetical protein
MKWSGAPLIRDRHGLERSTQVGFTRLAHIGAPISGKPEIGVCKKTGKYRKRTNQRGARGGLWKPHPEEARSAVSKDEASDAFALMLRDAARVRAAPQHEGGWSAAGPPIWTLGQEVFKIAPPAATT